MGRFRELVALIRAKHPGDRFFANYDQKLTVPELGDDYRAYERALHFLDSESWTELRIKAVNHFMDHRLGQRKQGFFNQLNDAFAYRHLVRRGYAFFASVSILAAGAGLGGLRSALLSILDYLRGPKGDRHEG
jgi:hypothetical protein